MWVLTAGSWTLNKFSYYFTSVFFAQCSWWVPRGNDRIVLTLTYPECTYHLFISPYSLLTFCWISYYKNLQYRAHYRYTYQEFLLVHRIEGYWIVSEFTTFVCFRVGIEIHVYSGGHEKCFISCYFVQTDNVKILSQLKINRILRYARSPVVPYWGNWHSRLGYMKNTFAAFTLMGLSD